jgi:23S rRNA (cytidine1920-2'-O)/16S rRNA (cytidine1409-2'-O)-methyltransferase
VSAYAQIVPRPTFLLALVSPIRQREKALAQPPGLFFAARLPRPPMTGNGTGRVRLDLALVRRGLAPSRARARDLIKRGLIEVAGKIEVRTAAGVAAPDSIRIIENAAGASGYVSRGALKLAAALEHFGFAVAGVIALDIGASTGGFSELMLARGARRIYAVDVGHGQLHPRLARQPALVSLEGCDARRLDRTRIPEPIGAIVADVSFISLTKALPAALALAGSPAWLIALIKPQFEAGRAAVGKGGIVRDPEARRRAVELVEAWLEGSAGWRVVGVIPSPILGGSGNQEFLIGAVHDG